ncbi:hypothetical protein [Nonomuraea dietziae]
MKTTAATVITYLFAESVVPTQRIPRCGLTSGIRRDETAPQRTGRAPE